MNGFLKAVLFAGLAMVCIGLWPTSCSAAEIILKDSTEIEEAYIQSGAYSAMNMARVEAAGATRVVVSQGPIYSGFRKICFRAPNLDSALDANSVTGEVDSAYIDWWIQSISNSEDSTGVYWVIRVSAIEAEKDWIEGNQPAATAIDDIAWDSCVHIGAGSGPGIAWGTIGCSGTDDTVGYRTGLTMDSVKMTMDSTKGDRVRFYLDPADIDNMRTPGANNGWILATSSKSGNISAAVQFYGSESNMSGATDSIPSLHLFYGGAPASATKKLGSERGAMKL